MNAKFGTEGVTGETESPTPAFEQLFICGGTMTYYADSTGSVLIDWPRRKTSVRRYEAERTELEPVPRRRGGG